MIARNACAWVAAVAWLLAGTSTSRAEEAAPAALQPPAGYTVAFTAKASGVQIYTSTSETGSPLKWTLEAPLAELRAPGGIIHHYAGPSWEAADGSRIVRDKDVPVASAPAKQASTDIPWLLIKVLPDATPGMLSKVAYVQRTSTSGGVAPATAPINAGTKIGVPYTATYVFYVKSH